MLPIEEGKKQVKQVKTQSVCSGDVWNLTFFAQRPKFVHLHVHYFLKISMLLLWQMGILALITTSSNAQPVTEKLD